MIGNLFSAISIAMMSGVLALGGINSNNVPQRVNQYPSSASYRGDNILITAEGEIAIQEFSALTNDEWYYYNIDSHTYEINTLKIK